jgi:hypothetical protein
MASAKRALPEGLTLIINHGLLNFFSSFICKLKSTERSNSKTTVRIYDH